MQGAPAASRQFFDRLWPEARAVSDEELHFYGAFSLGRYSYWQLLHPEIWGRAIKVFLKGHGTGTPHGDVRQVPGIYLVRDGEILWRHESRTTADRPDYQTLTQTLRAALQ